MIIGLTCRRRACRRWGFVACDHRPLAVVLVLFVGGHVQPPFLVRRAHVAAAAAAAPGRSSVVPCHVAAAAGCPTARSFTLLYCTISCSPLDFSVPNSLTSVYSYFLTTTFYLLPSSTYLLLPPPSLTPYI